MASTSTGCSTPSERGRLFSRPLQSPKRVHNPSFNKCTKKSACLWQEIAPARRTLFPWVRKGAGRCASTSFAGRWGMPSARRHRSGRAARTASWALPRAAVWTRRRCAAAARISSSWTRSCRGRTASRSPARSRPGRSCCCCPARRTCARQRMPGLPLRRSSPRRWTMCAARPWLRRTETPSARSSCAWGSSRRRSAPASSAAR